MRRALLVCAVVIGIGQLHGQEVGDRLPTTELVKKSLDAVVLIVTTDPAGREVAQGSGFIVSPDGRIVTNYHVVRGRRTAIIKLSNGAVFPSAQILTADETRDLALLKVPGNNLPVLKIANSDQVQIGERVLAIGSPLGLQNTVSEGIVSAIREESPRRRLVQTTAPASHGNSGGPLLREDGTVAGVITFGVIAGQNLNFAVPASDILALLSSADDATLLPGKARGAVGATAVKALGDVRKVYVERFGSTEAAALVREKLINRLAASGQLLPVDDIENADAVLGGVVSADAYGRADATVLRLTTHDGSILWAAEASAGGWGGSASSSIADKLAKKLLREIRKK